MTGSGFFLTTGEPYVRQRKSNHRRDHLRTYPLLPTGCSDVLLTTARFGGLFFVLSFCVCYTHHTSGVYSTKPRSIQRLYSGGIQLYTVTLQSTVTLHFTRQVNPNLTQSNYTRQQSTF